MLHQLRKLFEAPAPEIRKADVIDLTLAECVLLLEIARADDEFSEEERGHLLETMKQRYSLSEEEAQELIDLATQRRAESLDLWQFTNRVNETHDKKERIMIMEEIWRIIYADGSLDAHEDYLVRKMANLLRLSVTSDRPTSKPRRAFPAPWIIVPTRPLPRNAPSCHLVGNSSHTMSWRDRNEL